MEKLAKVLEVSSDEMKNWADQDRVGEEGMTRMSTPPSGTVIFRPACFAMPV
jgi:hypothetical protein